MNIALACSEFFRQIYARIYGVKDCTFKGIGFGRDNPVSRRRGWAAFVH